jgi:hypothetical protein
MLMSNTQTELLFITAYEYFEKKQIHGAMQRTGRLCFHNQLHVIKKRGQMVKTK